MRVVAKFAIAFVLASILCLGLLSRSLADREAARVERALAAGFTGYALGLRNAAEVAWRQRGLEGAKEVVSGFESNGTTIRARLDVSTPPDSATPPPQKMDEDALSLVERDAVHGVWRLRLPLRGPSDSEPSTATLTLERPMVDAASIFRDELVDHLFAAGALALMMGVLASVLGALVIGGPLSRIVAQARRIGAGDLSQRLRSTGTDEIGVLKRELNAMCDRLVEAHARIEEESTGRIETLERLRHLDRLRTVGTIASGIAHELGTPLNILLLRGQSLTREEEIDPSEVSAAGRAIVTQVEKMSRIVRQLLDFARDRPDRSKQGPRTGHVDLMDVVRQASSLLSMMAKKHHVEIAVHPPTDTGKIFVQADAVQLEQALTNLIVNGIQAMPDGGRLDITLSTEPMGVAVIEIRDQGEGMSAELRERIFEPFFTTKPKAQGTGLGLHVARGIVEDHGGTLTVESETKRGTTFVLKLPRDKDN